MIEVVTGTGKSWNYDREILGWHDVIRRLTEQPLGVLEEMFDTLTRSEPYYLKINGVWHRYRVKHPNTRGSKLSHAAAMIACLGFLDGPFGGSLLGRGSYVPETTPDDLDERDKMRSKREAKIARRKAQFERSRKSTE